MINLTFKGTVGIVVDFETFQLIWMERNKRRIFPKFRRGAPPEFREENFEEKGRSKDEKSSEHAEDR